MKTVDRIMELVEIHRTAGGSTEHQATKATLRFAIEELVADVRESTKMTLLLAEDLQYIAGIVAKGRGQPTTKDDLKVRAAILGYVQELEEKAKDTARLEWAMNNMSNHNYTLFGMHVMNVGGTGDIGDCRGFVDKRIKEST